MKSKLVAEISILRLSLTATMGSFFNAVVTEIIGGDSNVLYSACAKCGSRTSGKTHEDAMLARRIGTNSLRPCPKCHCLSPFQYKYCLKLKVLNEEESLCVIMWGDAANSLFGVGANELHATQCSEPDICHDTWGEVCMLSGGVAEAIRTYFIGRRFIFIPIDSSQLRIAKNNYGFIKLSRIVPVREKGVGIGTVVTILSDLFMTTQGGIFEEVRTFNDHSINSGQVYSPTARDDLMVWKTPKTNRVGVSRLSSGGIRSKSKKNTNYQNDQNDLDLDDELSFVSSFKPMSGIRKASHLQFGIGDPSSGTDEDLDLDVSFSRPIANGIEALDLLNMSMRRVSDSLATPVKTWRNPRSRLGLPLGSAGDPNGQKQVQKMEDSDSESVSGAGAQIVEFDEYENELPSYLSFNAQSQSQSGLEHTHTHEQEYSYSYGDQDSKSFVASDVDMDVSHYIDQSYDFDAPHPAGTPAPAPARTPMRSATASNAGISITSVFSPVLFSNWVGRSRQTHMQAERRPASPL